MDTMIHEKCLLSKYVMIRSVHYWHMNDISKPPANKPLQPTASRARSVAF